MKRIFISIIILLGLTYATPARAQQSTPQPDDVNRVASQLYCPVCENTPLDVCPTQACAQWRNLIRDKLAAGWTDDQIKQYFAAQYGIRVLAEPPTPLIYIVPPILILLGIVVLIRAFRSMRRKSATVTAAPPAMPSATVDDVYLSRVEEELKKRN
jgi:cytochrome c-type biogenesis protein CcmH